MIGRKEVLTWDWSVYYTTNNNQKEQKYLHSSVSSDLDIINIISEIEEYTDEEITLIRISLIRVYQKNKYE